MEKQLNETEITRSLISKRKNKVDEAVLQEYISADKDFVKVIKQRSYTDLLLMLEAGLYDASYQASNLSHRIVINTFTAILKECAELAGECAKSVRRLEEYYVSDIGGRGYELPANYFYILLNKGLTPDSFVSSIVHCLDSDKVTEFAQSGNKDKVRQLLRNTAKAMIDTYQ